MLDPFWQAYVAAVTRARPALTAYDLLLLAAIPEAGDGIGTVALSELVGVTPGNISRRVHVLAGRRLCRAVKNPEDRRHVLITRTAEGTKSLSRLIRN